MSIFEKIIRQWRIASGVPIGLHVWFDPDVERVRLFAVHGKPGVERDKSLDTVSSGVHNAMYGSVSASEAEAEPINLYNDCELSSLPSKEVLDGESPAIWEED
jgi:hypothetical protein